MVSKDEQATLFGTTDSVPAEETPVKAAVKARAKVTVVTSLWRTTSSIKNGTVWIPKGSTVTDKDVDAKDVPEWLEQGILVPIDDAA